MTRPLVVFDFDGTLTDRDTSVAFLRAVAGPVAVSCALGEVAICSPLDLLPSIRPAHAGDTWRLREMAGRAEGRFHERLTRRLLRGRTREALQAVGAAFATRLVANGLRPDVLACVAAHRAAGHRLWIVSASLDLYLTPLAERLGIEGALGTALQFDGNLATGRFAGLPCWGHEKLRRIRTALGVTVPIQRAYGNGTGDLPLLAAAVEPVRVTRRGAWMAPAITGV